MKVFWPVILASSTLFATGTAGACAVVTPMRGGARAYYEQPPGEALAAIFIAAFIAFLGVQAVIFRYRNRVAVLAIASTGLALFSLVTGFPSGIFVAPFALTAIVLLLLFITRSSHPSTAILSALTGAGLGLGGMALWIAYVWPPLVVCEPGGSGSSSPGSWWDRKSSGGGFGTASARPDGVVTGTIRADGQTVHYRCEGGRLVEVRWE